MDRLDHAASLFAHGHRQVDVARACGVSRSTASRWHKRWVAGTLHDERRGRPPRLGAGRMREVNQALAAPPRESGFDLDQWSLAAAAALIERQTGVRYHHRHVGRLLRRIGWIVPPVGRHHEALRRREVRDMDGNVVNLIQRVKPCASR